MQADTVAIAQPTFLPWAGWFDLADQADLLIILDDVAFSKQSWQQRNRIRTPAGLSYISLSVRTAGRLGQKIIDAELADPAAIGKISRTIAAHYEGAPYFERYFPEFERVFADSAARGFLCDVNIGLIEWLAAQLDITTRRVCSSEIEVMDKRGAYVAKLCQHFGASRYISPPGAEAYLLEDFNEFQSRDITVDLHVYEHPVYRQCFEPFIPYASVLDLILNEGEAAAGILRSGRQPMRPLRPALTNALEASHGADS